MNDDKRIRTDHATTTSSRRPAIILLIVFAVLLVVGSALIADLSGSLADSDQQFDDIHAAKSDRLSFIAGGALLTLAALSAVPTVITMIARVPVSNWRAVHVCAVAFTLLFAALLIASAASYSTVAASREFGGLYDDTDQFQTGSWVLPQLATILFIGASMAASGLIISISAMLHPPHRRVRALRIGGGIVALLLPLSFAGPPLIVLLPLWLLFVVLTSDNVAAQHA